MPSRNVMIEVGVSVNSEAIQSLSTPFFGSKTVGSGGHAMLLLPCHSCYVIHANAMECHAMRSATDDKQQTASNRRDQGYGSYGSYGSYAATVATVGAAGEVR